MDRSRAPRGEEHRLGDPLRVVALVAGLLLVGGIVLAFAGVSHGVVEGETRRFDEAALLRINALLPDWLNEPMRIVTALGYYWVVLPLLTVATYAFYRVGERGSAALLAVSTLGGVVLTTILKCAFGRPRPDLFDSGYAASSYAFPSGHATVAVGFYGMLAVLLALRLSGGVALGGGSVRGDPSSPHRLLAPLPRSPLPNRRLGRFSRRSALDKRSRFRAIFVPLAPARSPRKNLRTGTP